MTGKKIAGALQQLAERYSAVDGIPMTAQRIRWDSDSSRGYNVEVASVGRFQAQLVHTGAGTIGVNVWIGLFNGELVAVSPTRERAVAAIQREAMRMLVEAGASLEVSR